jgi:hypothetical protein
MNSKNDLETERRADGECLLLELSERLGTCLSICWRGFHVSERASKLTAIAVGWPKSSMNSCRWLPLFEWEARKCREAGPTLDQYGSLLKHPDWSAGNDRWAPE